MKTGRFIRIGFYLLAVFFVLTGLYCLLWVMSSYSLAFVDCNGTYSLTAETFRCRQPPLAGLLALASFVLAGLMIYVARRAKKQKG